MLGCNQYVTLWSRKKIRETGHEIFIRRILPVKCKWRGGTDNKKEKVVVIPYFDDMADENMRIKKGDIIALGVCNIEITGNTPYTASEVRRLLSPNIIMIDSVSHNFDGNKNMKGRHLRLTGN